MTNSSSPAELESGEGVFSNPILPGGFPDPSICRVGEDFFLVNSSFEYFPGLPIHRSRDLVIWELVGYGLQREEQCCGVVNLQDVQTRGGIHAPTLRFHAGFFYIITTHVYQPPDPQQPTRFVNFIISARDVTGPWSDPLVVEGAPGIDPDLFFDEDGKSWYVGTRQPEEPDYPGQGEIWLQELDLSSGCLSGQRYSLWRGACGGTWVEGPHLYKRNGVYYLLVAEGGTGYNHAVMVAASEKINGPYISNPRNPILTARHLSYDHWVHSTGHGDLFELPDGRWYMVLLGVRADEQGRSNMGRETHLVEVEWELEPSEPGRTRLEWPVCAPRSGRVERFNTRPFPGGREGEGARSLISYGIAAPEKWAFEDHFIADSLNLEWNFRRVPGQGVFSLHERPGFLRLYAGREVFAERGSCHFLGFRQRESYFDYQVWMEFVPNSDGLEAGLVLLQQDDNYIQFTVCRQAGSVFLKLTLASASGAVVLLDQIPLPEYQGNICLRVVSQDHRYRYEYHLENGQAGFTFFTETGAHLIVSYGYTGAYLGLYATSAGKQVAAHADFSQVRCLNIV